jgi:hypothetical protein
VFSKIDLRSRYHQIKIHAENIPLIAFSTRYGLYEYVVMSFRLTNALAHFMYLMNSVFMSELDKFIVFFINDILVYSKNMEEHEEHLHIVLVVRLTREESSIQVFPNLSLHNITLTPLLREEIITTQKND